MPSRKSRTMSREQRRAAFLELAARMFNQLDEWYDEYPDATFGEIEAQGRQYRLKLMGEAFALLINGRTEGYQLDAPTCAECGQTMKFVDYRERTVGGLEGDTTLSRAYYVCPRCEDETFFPPGPPTSAPERSLE
jgi:hypothetical protein